MKKLLNLMAVSLAAWNLYGQGSWSDNFNSGSLGSGWFQSGQYLLTVESNQLKVSVNKSSMWASFGVNISAQDVRSKPIVNVKVKTSKPFLFTCWLVSSAGNIPLTIPVLASSNYNNLCFDFTGKDANNNVLNAVTTILFGVNGEALSWGGTFYMDDVMLGNAATKYAGVSSVADQVFYQGTTNCKIFLRGISNASSLSLTGADAYIQNISFDPITNGTTWLKFDCKAGVSGTVTATLTANPTTGWTANSTTFTLEVEGNKNPTLDPIPNMQACKSLKKTIQLTGISDGNAAADQSLTITATSNNTSVIDNPSVTYSQGSRYATLEFTPKAAGSATITVTVNDGQASNNTTTRSFTVNVLNEWNNPPTIQSIPNKETVNNAGEQTITLTGISDGDNGTQTLTFSATSSDPTVIPNPVIQYTGGSTATLKYTPSSSKTGIVTITITITDNGGNAQNNGNQSTVTSFKIETYSPPLTGYVIPFNGTTPNAYDSVVPGLKDYWYVEELGVTQNVSYVTDGSDKVLQISCNNKSTWTGTWYYTPDMDLTDYPLISLWVKCDQTIRFHLYFWDDSIRNNEDHHLEFTVNANTWTKLNFDFSDPNGMLNASGLKVNAKRIKKVLFNYHPSFGWPFTNWSGTVRMKDIRIGDQSGITPTYYCTIDPVGPQTWYMDNNPRTIKLTGISRGKDNIASVSVSGNGTLKNVSVSSVVNGQATITCTPSTAGTDNLSVTVTGAAINGKLPVSKTITIPVTIVNKSSISATVPTIDLSQQKQIYRGVGGHGVSAKLLEQYTTGGYGATAIRIGIFDDNQIEPANDNGDPMVLDRSKLNYNAFDWDFIRGLKERGVETFLVTIWSPPAWMKENLSTNYQQPNALQWENTINRVMTAYYDEYAEYVVALALMFKEEAGIELAGIGIQNEPAFCEPYESAILGPTQFADMVARVGTRFAALGIKTKLYFAEQVGVKMTDGPIYTNQQYLNAMNSNATAKQYSDVFAVHGYASDGVNPGDPPGSADWANTYNAINANGKARELWMTETEPTFSNWNDAFVNAANILTAFESGNVGLWTEWAWDGHCIDKGQPTQKYWAQSMFQNIKPGAVRRVSTSNHNDILITTWKNDAAHGDNYVIVLMNKGNSPLAVNINNASLPSDFTVFRCSEYMARYMDGKYTKGDKLLLPARSIVTLVSGLKATPTIDQVSPQLVMNDGANKTINLTGITDGNPTNQNPITLTYSLSNPAVISNVSLNYTSPNKTGTFNFRPATTGTTEVTINVTADGVTTSMKFTLQVKDYSAPNINPITTAKDYDLGSPIVINLSGINDGDNGTQTLSVSAAVTSSSPAGVLGTPQVSYTSPNTTGTITITPLKPGTAELTVTVTDNGPAGKNTTSIKATIVVVQHFAPTISKLSDTTVALKKMAQIPIRITNGGDADSIVSVTVKSSDEKVTGVAYVAPLNDYITFFTLAEGTATITLTVTDNGPTGKNTTTASFKVTVQGNTPIAIENNNDNVAVYPNPSSSVLHVNGLSQYSVWKLTTAGGMIVKAGTVTSDVMDIDVSDLAQGTYILMLGNKDNYSGTIRFMKR